MPAANFGVRRGTYYILGVTTPMYRLHHMPLPALIGWAGIVLIAALAACQPTVKVEVPREPITINLNIKLDADVRLRIEEEAEQDVENNPIF